MKRIEATIKPFKLEDVKNAIQEVADTGLTIREVHGFGRQKGHTEVMRGSEYTVDFLPKLQLVVYVPDAVKDAMIEAIIRSAKTGKIGDGKIFVSDVIEAIRIRNGESGDDAL